MSAEDQLMRYPASIYPPSAPEYGWTWPQLDSNNLPCMDWFWDATYWLSRQLFVYTLIDSPTSGRTGAITNGLYFGSPQPLLPLDRGLCLLEQVYFAVGFDRANLDSGNTFNLQLVSPIPGGSDLEVVDLGVIDSPAKILNPYYALYVFSDSHPYSLVRAFNPVGSPTLTDARVVISFYSRNIYPIDG